MNETQAANEIRSSFAESVLLFVGERGGQVVHDELDQFTGDQMTTRDAVVELNSLGLLDDPDYDSVRLTPFGRRVADRIRESLLTGQRRADIVQRELLRWLSTRSAGPGAIEEFAVLAEASAHGREISELEIQHAAELLEERGFIAAVSTAERRWLRPRITADGRAALASDVLISEYGRPNATVTTYDFSSRVIFGNHATTGGVISGGSGHSQFVTQTVSGEKREALQARAAELLTLAAEVPDGETLRDVLEQLQKESVADAPREPVVKELLHKAMGAAATAAGTTAGQQILVGLAGVASMIP